MHDNKRKHKNIHHQLYTPNTTHYENLRKIAKTQAVLTGRSKRHAVESQMLANPALSRYTSVSKMQCDIGKVQQTCECLVDYPELPSCQASAAQSLRDNPIWAKSFYAHCHHLLQTKMKEHNFE